MTKRVSKFPFFHGLFLLGCVCLVGIARQGPAVAAAILALSTAFMLHVTILIYGLLASVLFGMALGMIWTLLPVAWVDFFVRKNYGSIRGISLAIQVTAQAIRPIISGIMWDSTGDYRLSLWTVTGMSIFSIFFALSARPPK